ncbi:hypothetical protein FSS13T_05530 [Flavobacterium saliperosum S13]|uniref:Uncharacterized protein n=2 Tax=Flavobacterium saliperosum TaxID=329186 RepID=A0A1G4VAF6_9FLAO|nr:hypothetical protein [Flavobacterium saliperosum]ESU28062.1 hypothetical protein FSS13T_05530 [Flavobacterium saliperosum S13]SCX02886.1 hypothetical protein SAMN02927925_00580 [Flavobacterium saliperosum]
MIYIPESKIDSTYKINIEKSNSAFSILISQRKGQLPTDSPVEIHPYLSELDLDNYDKYIIGTFPPISYCYRKYNLELLTQPNNTKINEPNLAWFHGNLGSMWDLFLSQEELIYIYNQDIDELNRIEYLKNILQTLKLNYSDIIYSTKRKLDNNKYTAEDSKLTNIILNNELYKHIVSNKNVNRLLFNTSSVFGVEGLKIHQNKNKYGDIGKISLTSKITSFDLFFRGLQDLNIGISFSLDGKKWCKVEKNNAKELNKIFKTKLIFKVKLILKQNFNELGNKEDIEKELFIITPFSPAAVNRGMLLQNPIVANWLGNSNPFNLLQKIYTSFIRFEKEDLDFLYSLNI